MDDIQSARQYFAKLKIGDVFFKNFLNAVKSGNNTVSQTMVTESLIADEGWINEIESLLFSVEQIVKDPKKSIMDEKLIVQIEKARKITSESIRHLSSHSSLVRSVDEDGVVQPSKILTTYMEEDLLIYENKFVYTLITRLISFLEQKYNYLKEFSGTYSTSNLKLKSEFKFNETMIDYDLNVRIKSPVTDAENKVNENIFYRIEQLKKRVSVLMSSEFYRVLSKTKPINPPIQKTNIIMMNTDYKNCYKLWLFLSSFINTGYSVKVSDKSFPVEQGYIDDLSYLVAITLKAMMANDNYIAPFNDEDKYLMQEPKEFNVIKGFNYIPSFKDLKIDETQEDYLNQFYYEKIKEILTAEENKAENSVEEKADLVFPFVNFYRQLAKINNMIFAEMLEFREKYTDAVNLSKIESMQKELEFRKEMYRRSHLLTRLKAIDLRDTERKEIGLLSKVRALQYEIDVLKQKQKEEEEALKEIKPQKPAVHTLKKRKKKTVPEVLKEKAENDRILAQEILGAELEESPSAKYFPPKEIPGITEDTEGAVLTEGGVTEKL